MGKTAPEGINDIVYKTAGGSVFHNDSHCELLFSGQHIAETSGKQSHPINPFPWTSVAEFGACSWCCAWAFYMKGQRNLVKAMIDQNWVTVDLIATRPIGHGYKEYRVRTEEGIEIVLRKKHIQME